MRLEIKIHKVKVEASKPDDGRSSIAHPLSEGIFGQRYVTNVRILNGTVKHDAQVEAKRFDELTPKIIGEVERFDKDHPNPHPPNSIFDVNLSMECVGKTKEGEMLGSDGRFKVVTTTSPLDAEETHYFFRAIESVMVFMKERSDKLKGKAKDESKAS
jgi:hypothetical protein